MAAAVIRILDMKLQTIILTVGWSRTKLTVSEIQYRESLTASLVTIKFLFPATLH